MKSESMNHKPTAVLSTTSCVCVRARKACETLALDLRGYGTHLIAPEMTRMAKSTTTGTTPCPAADDDDHHYQLLPPPFQGRCATAGAAATRTRTRTTTKAWTSGRVEGSSNNGGGGGTGGGRNVVGSWPSPTAGVGVAAGGSSRPPPFGPVRGTTVQEARAIVVIDQVSFDERCLRAVFVLSLFLRFSILGCFL